MVEPLNISPILEKLWEKTRQGKLPWIEGDFDSFSCELDAEYILEVFRRKDGYGLRMMDRYRKELAALKAEDELIFRDMERKQVFERLKDVYELARRQALNIPEKLATVSHLLDRV